MPDYFSKKKNEYRIQFDTVTKSTLSFLELSKVWQIRRDSRLKCNTSEAKKLALVARLFSV